MTVFFFQAEDGIRDLYVTGVQTVLFRSKHFRRLPQLLSIPTVTCAREIGARAERRRRGIRKPTFLTTITPRCCRTSRLSILIRPACSWDTVSKESAA